MIDRACISINNHCNLNCKYCYFYEREDINTNNLKCFTKEDLEIIINNIVEYVKTKKMEKQFTIGIVGSGEPLLNFNEIKHIIQYIKDKKYENYLRLYTISNGYYINEQILNFFYDNKCIISLSFSLDGFKELHDKFRMKLVNGEYIGTFDHVIKNIEFYESIFNAKPAINCTVSSETLKFKDKLEQFYLDNRFFNITFSKIFDVPKELSITYNEFNDFVNSFSNEIKIRNIEAYKLNKLDCSMYGAICGVGITNIFYSDNKIYPCGRFTGNDNFILANYDDNLLKVEEKYKNDNIYKNFDNIRHKRVSFYDSIK